MTDRYVHAEPVMGTVVTFDIRDAAPSESAVRAACTWLHEVDQTFSTYRSDSAICRLDRGELRVADAPEAVRKVLIACALLHAETNGAFDVYAAGPLDPSAFVKGWAAQRATAILEKHGLRNFQVNAGGDIVVRGDSDESGEGWRLGVRHPLEPTRFAAVVRLRDASIATSAQYERGQHIIDPSTRQPVTDVSSVTVVADDLGRADALATALFAAGPDRLGLLESLTDIEALIVAGDRTTSTNHFPAVSASSTAS